MQTGAAYVERAEPLEWPTGLPVDDMMIETFVASADGSITPAGDDEDANQIWMPVVESFTATVLAAAAKAGVRFDGDAYVTASITPVEDVAGMPHFDDDLYNANEGVGFVAIAGRIGGPRVACAPIECASLRSPTQVPVDDDTAQRFLRGGLDRHTAGADRIVVFPQFAQLHSGPPLAEDPDSCAEPARHLLVFRAGTLPTT